MTPASDDHQIDVPVITSTGLGGGARATTFSVERYTTPTGAWLYLGDGTDQRIEVSLESARRLIEEITRLIQP